MATPSIAKSPQSDTTNAGDAAAQSLLRDSRNVLSVLDPSDSRIGVDLFTSRSLAVMNGMTVGGIQARLKSADVLPVACLPSGEYLFPAAAVREYGILPDAPFDPEREAWVAEIAAEMGVCPRTSLMFKLQSRHGKRLDLGRPATVEELAAAGVIRRFGRPWAFNREKVADLLRAPYDPERETTTQEILARYGHFANAANLARAMRGHVDCRRVRDLDGRDRYVWDRAGVAEFFAGRNRTPRTGQSREVLPEAGASVWRDRVGPFTLAAPTRRTTVAVADAGWLLGVAGRELDKLLGSTPEVRVPGEAGVAIAWLETVLADRGDLEALLLLARVIDGRLVLDRNLDRTSALLRVTEKAA